MRMDKVLIAYTKLNPEASVSDFAHYWKNLNIFFDVKYI